MPQLVAYAEQMSKVLPQLRDQLDQIIKVTSGFLYSDKVITVTVQLRDYVDKLIKLLPRFTNYDEQTIQVLIQFAEYSDKVIEFLPKLTKQLDYVFTVYPSLTGIYDQLLTVKPLFTGLQDFAVKFLPRFQTFTEQLVMVCSQYQTFEQLFIITITRGEYDPLILVFQLLRDNWSLTGDLSKDNLTFTTGWYDERISFPQLTIMPLTETGVPVETGKQPYYSQFYSLLINIWVRPKQDSNFSIGWAKNAQYQIRKEVERILKAGARLDAGTYEQFLTLRGWRGLDETDKRPVIFRQQLEVVDNFYRKS